MDLNAAVVPGYYLVCYNMKKDWLIHQCAVVPGYYLVCYNFSRYYRLYLHAVVPGYYLVCYNSLPCTKDNVRL